VVLLEAANALGGQVRLASEASWRRDLIGIVEWRAAELAHLDVDVRLNTYAEPDDVRAFAPDIVVVATGGVPDFGWLQGGEHATSAWSLIDGSVAPAERVLVYDGSGRHTAMVAAEKVAAAGKKVSLVTLDDHLCMDLTSPEQTFWKRRAHQLRLPLSFDLQLVGIARRGNALVARFSNELTNETVEEEADQIVVEQGTLPVAEVYEALRSGSTNDGVTDIDALIAGQPQPRLRDGKGYELHRIGDAVSSRNIHSAIYDALRLCHVM
jgi:hypothetical protein